MLERHKFAWRDGLNGSRELVVFDIPVLSYQTEDDHWDWRGEEPFGDAELQAMVDNFNDSRERKGKTGAYLFLNHNTPEVPAKIIGRLDNLRFDRPWLRADAVIKDPEAQRMALNDQLPNWSAEFYPKANVLWGLSLIQGQEGHHGEEEAEFLLGEEVQLEALAMLSAKNVEGVKLISKPLGRQILLTQEKPDMTVEEQLAQILKNQEELSARVGQLEGGAAGEAEKNAGEGEGMPDAEEKEKNEMAGPNDVVDEKDVVGLRAEVRGLKISRKADEIKAAGCYLPVSEIVKKLSACKTAEGFDLTVEKLSSLKAPERGDLGKPDASQEGASQGSQLQKLSSDFHTSTRKRFEESGKGGADALERYREARRLNARENAKAVTEMREVAKKEAATRRA